MTVQPLAWALLVAAVGKIEELLSTLRADTGSCPFSGARALSFPLGGARIRVGTSERERTVYVFCLITLALGGDR